MSPIIIDRLVNLENLNLNFARPQALYETSPANSSTPLITARTVVILIDLIIVVFISLLLLLGYFLYRRQLKRKQKFTNSIETSEAEMASESKGAVIMDNHCTSATTVVEKEEPTSKI
ncbi:hypothetical protein PtB15_7B215 [Puccinia triticina]|nr:hypothetical protein PtB15_7B215 [Puccinia triticina]